jgi:hypothetical protein
VSDLDPVNAPGALIVSVHIPKTGGVSFREALGELAGPHLVQDYGDQPLAPRSGWRRLRERFRAVELPPGTRVVHGHFVASKYWRAYPEARFVAWLRHPVERTVSHYHYWLREPDLSHPLCRRVVEEKLSLEAFAELAEMRDVHVRFLGGVPLARFAFVGLTERFDEGMELFRRLFCPERALSAERRNTNPERADAGYALSKPVRDTIEAANRADLELYARARERYQEIRDGAGAR